MYLLFHLRDDRRSGVSEARVGVASAAAPQGLSVHLSPRLAVRVHDLVGQWLCAHEGSPIPALATSCLQISKWSRRTCLRRQRRLTVGCYHKRSNHGDHISEEPLEQGLSREK
ncbi:hypothetical protein MPH_01462 [Macrophomina phaseolina MS6]|uniref:Uncharacterized protein n=1 Tax=Macrophomina phaseolina (strain MS6) TaxID=1126212 RepID=K2SFG6_MACPH|nr:hypothetical protein MPH_01462 [Macrophomina phaseolina MS6]